MPSYQIFTRRLPAVELQAAVGIPMDSAPLKDSPAAVTSGGVWKALQEYSRDGEPTNLNELLTTNKDSIVGAINEVFERTLRSLEPAQDITEVLAAPLSVLPSRLVLGGDCVSNDVQVLAFYDGFTQAITGVFQNGVTVYNLSAGWADLSVSIGTTEALRFYQDPRLAELDGLYTKPAAGIPGSDLSAQVTERLVPLGGTTGQLLTRDVNGGLLWETSSGVVVATQGSATVALSGVGSAEYPLAARVEVSAQSGNQLSASADGLYVATQPGVFVSSSDSVSLAKAENGVLTASIVVSASDGNQLSVRADGLYVDASAEAMAAVRFDGAQGLSVEAQQTARSNIGAPSTEQLSAAEQNFQSANTVLANSISTLQTTLSGTTATANTAVTAAVAAQTDAERAQAAAEDAIAALTDKVPNRSGTGVFVYTYSGDPGVNAGIQVSANYAAGLIPQYSATGVLTGAAPVAANDLAPKGYVDALVAAATNGLYIGAYFYGLTNASTTPPLPTAAIENYFDFTTQNVYTARPDLSGWDFAEQLSIAQNGAAVYITKAFWDLTLDAGLPGVARWDSAVSAWDYMPTQGTVAPDNTSIVFNSLGALAVAVSATSGNRVIVNSDGLYVPPTVQQLPTPPAVPGDYTLRQSAGGVLAWSADAMAEAQTDATQALANAASAQADATQALANGANAQTDATQALANATSAQTDATQALTNAASATQALSSKVDKVVPSTGVVVYTATSAAQTTTPVSSAAQGSTVALRDSAGHVKVANAVADDDAVSNAQFSATTSALTTSVTSVTTQIQAAQTTATNAANAAAAATTTLNTVQATQATYSTKPYVSTVTPTAASATGVALTVGYSTLAGATVSSSTAALPVASASVAGVVTAADYTKFTNATAVTTAARKPGYSSGSKYFGNIGGVFTTSATGWQIFEVIPTTPNCAVKIIANSNQAVFCGYYASGGFPVTVVLPVTAGDTFSCATSNNSAGQFNTVVLALA